jgi:hypothetical protein
MSSLPIVMQDVRAVVPPTLVAPRTSRSVGELLEAKEKPDGNPAAGRVPLGFDGPTLRAAFNELMAQFAVVEDVDQKPTTIGGVNAIDVTIRAPRPRALPRPPI